MGDTMPAGKPDPELERLAELEKRRPKRKVEKLADGWTRITIGDKQRHIPPHPPRIYAEPKENPKP